ncbi:hypothetical protein V8C86DRAFT_2589425, partial [Haematococcus lacustris]
MEQGATARPLDPGQLSKPAKVWCTATSVRIAWYQAQPVSDVVTVFYKKTGSVFGTEVTLPATSLLGPELSIRQPAALGAAPTEYYELEIKKLKPSTAYVVKIKSEGPGEGGEGLAVRSERLLTLSVEEERNRDIEMAAFAGQWLGHPLQPASLPHFHSHSSWTTLSKQVAVIEHSLHHVPSHRASPAPSSVPHPHPP